MGKIDGCLKAVFISFNCLFASFGCLLICGLIRMSLSGYKMEGLDTPSVIWLWVFAIITLLVSLLGSHAARTENKCGLKLFAVLMGIGMALMLIVGVAAIVLKDKGMENFQSPEVAQEILKDEKKKHLLKTLQGRVRCCGWTGVEDWGSDIPQSCRCTPSYGPECKSSLLGFSSVYSKACGEIVKDYVEYYAKIGICIIFGFAFVAMMGLIISAKMINQISHHDRVVMPTFGLKAY
ncbi:23 kDa integral membrane protein-like [Gambusia affinis]|uniref:23 kDa integral membrane protein-like n=1 Tax=Gambusia affinis TaxID=33528 RepID=UPI001CDBD033|nr:23 kDa integral membrane protein-like [Gambusia affinis]